jgi:hypothetical protein
MINRNIFYKRYVILAGVLLVGLGLLVPSIVSAATFYVAPDGSDNNSGTKAEPFKSLEYAHDQAEPGDTIYLRGGTFRLSEGIRLTNDGSRGNPIEVFAYPGETPVLDGAGMWSADYYDGWPLWLDSLSWNHLKGIEIKNGPMGGLVIDGQSHHNIIEGLNVHHNGRLSEWEGKGISLFGPSSNNLLLNNDSHHNKDIREDNADGFQVTAYGEGNVLRGNRAWRNSDDGYDFFNVSSSNNVDGGEYLLEYNWAWENGYDEDGNVAGDGNGFKLGGRRPQTSGNTSGGHTVRYNLSWDNRRSGFTENSANKRITFHHNTAYRNGLYDYTAWTVPHTFHNNLSYKSDSGVDMSNGSSDSNNSWTLDVTVKDKDFLSLNDNVATGPRESDGSLPESDFLRLQSDSNLVDTGRDVGLDFEGSAPDIGAFESELDNTETEINDQENDDDTENENGSDTGNQEDDNNVDPGEDNETPAINCEPYFKSGDSAPRGFGIAWNHLTSQRELLIDSVNCSQSAIEFMVGSGKPYQYVYNKAYRWDGSGWQLINLTGSDRVDHWIVGEAFGETQFSTDGTVIVGYVCQYSNGQWQCGCDSERCQTPSWQLQLFKSN